MARTPSYVPYLAPEPQSRSQAPPGNALLLRLCLSSKPVAAWKFIRQERHSNITICCSRNNPVGGSEFRCVQGNAVSRLTFTLRFSFRGSELAWGRWRAGNPRRVLEERQSLKNITFPGGAWERDNSTRIPKESTTRPTAPINYETERSRAVGEDFE